MAWPGLAGVSTFVLYRAARFQRDVGGDPVGRLVLLMVVGSVMTWAALAALASVELAEGGQPALLLPLFLLWAGSMVLITWIMHRWGAEALRLRRYHEELAQMDRMKARLINTVAHEINTPLTPIRFRVATLKAGGLGPTTPKQDESLANIERNLDRVDALVARMLLALHLETGKVQLHVSKVPLGSIADQVVRSVASSATEKGVHVQVEPAAATEVEADPARLAIALEAVVSNAVKFTPPGGRVEVRPVQLDGMVGLEVRDTGAGLSPDARRALFQPLRQEHATHMTESGAGLGLYISQSILRLHGGRVTVESEGVGKGATFRLLLPRR